MTGKPQDRAIRAALALLHQPGAAGADGAGEAWRTVEEIGRIGGRLRSAIDEAAVFRTLEAPETCGTCGTPATLGTWSSEAGPWTAAATQLAERVEEATAWWTAGSGFCWPAWDESSAAALGTLLCELDALAAALLIAADHDPAPSPAFPAVAVGAGTGAETETDTGADGTEPDVRHRVRRRGPGGRLVPSIGLAAVAVVGVLGGITVAATQVGQTGVAKRAIASEPVPYTLHDGEPSTAAGGRENPGTQQTRGTAAPGTAQQPAAPGGPISLASAVAAPSNADPASASGSPGAPGTAPVAQQGSKTPQPRDGGAPPSIPVAVMADPQQLADVVSDIRAQAERLQAEQLRELAERMRAAMGLGY
jgi:hypothetical protein